MPGLGDPYMRGVLRAIVESMRSKGCEVRFATVLREPVAEVVSLMRFRHVTQRDFVQGVRENSEAMSKYLVYNFWRQWPAIYRAGPPTQKEGKQLLHAAQHILGNFSLVGRTERLDEFVANVNLMLGWPASLIAPRENVAGREDSGEDGWEFYQPGARQLAQVRKANIFDSHLYHSYCTPSKGSTKGMRAQALVARSETPTRRPDGLGLLERVLNDSAHQWAFS